MKKILCPKKWIAVFVALLTLTSCTTETTITKPVTTEVIEVAVSCRMPPEVTEAVKTFNATHDGVRIQVNDYYTKYAVQNDSTPAVQRLALDISTGVLEPDIVIEFRAEQDNATSYLVENGLYTDLTPLIDEDIFSCVRHSFSDGDKMWGITDSFYVNTVLINAATLEENYLQNEEISPEEMAKFSEKLLETGTWTVDEMLDYIDSLPEGVEFMKYLTQSNVMNTEIYPVFIDTESGTCNFTGETFVRYLEYMKTLPKKINTDTNGMYADFRSGKIAACHYDMHGIIHYSGMDAVFAGEALPIGYPVLDGKLADIFYNYTYVITSHTEHPDMAWEYLKLLLNSVGAENVTEFPTLKSVFREQCAFAKTCVFAHDIVGTSGIYPLEEESFIEQDMYDNYITHFTEEDAKALEDFLENKVGVVRSNALSDDVMSILSEEVSAYLADNTDATACAERIQNRVSLWLAERN